MEVIKIFKEFINVVIKNQKYTVALLDEEGFIISCSNPKLIQSNIKNLNSEDIIVDDIEINGRFYGKLLVQGNEGLEMIAGILLESLKTRLLYEIDEFKLQEKLSVDDQIIKYILSDEPLNQSSIVSLVEEIGIDQTKTRVAMLVINPTGFNKDEVTRLKLKKDSNEILYTLLDSKKLLIFKDVSDSDSDTFEYEIHEYIEGLQQWGLVNCSFYVGSHQNQMAAYRDSYQQSLWLSQNMNIDANHTVIFKDCAMRYFASFISNHTLAGYFDFFIEQLNEEGLEELIQIADALFSNNFNISQAANSIFIHKNTLIYKLQKFEELFQIKIRSDFDSKMVFSLLSYYANNKLQEKKVGLRREE